MAPKASEVFHVWNPDTARSQVFAPGDDVPDNIAELVGDHVLDRSEDSDDGGVLKGQALDDAVAAANEDGAEIKVSGTADEKREALADYETAKKSAGEPLKGQALDDAVKAANDAGADIKGNADEKRAGLAAFQEQQAAAPGNVPPAT